MFTELTNEIAQFYVVCPIRCNVRLFKENNTQLTAHTTITILEKQSVLKEYFLQKRAVNADIGLNH